MPPDDNSSHYEEPNIDQDDRYDWSNEGPNELIFWIQEAPSTTLIRKTGKIMSGDTL